MKLATSDYMADVIPFLPGVRNIPAALKHGIRNPETETEYGIRNTESVKEGSKRSIWKKNISNDNKINKQIFLKKRNKWIN